MGIKYGVARFAFVLRDEICIMSPEFPCPRNFPGGVDAPYIWLKTPDNMTSWEFFDKLLNECNVVGTPGSGFGPSGEGYFRLSAFGHRENVIEAVERIKKNLK